MPVAHSRNIGNHLKLLSMDVIQCIISKELGVISHASYVEYKLRSAVVSLILARASNVTRL